MEILLINSKWPPKSGQYKQKIVLSYDEWDDYSYKTSFDMSYCDILGKVIPIAQVKIYNYYIDSARTKDFSKHTKETLPTKIVQLDSNYCSLGQDLKYYRKLKGILPNDYMDILKRLNDIAICDAIREKYIDEDGVQTSLLRFSSAVKALEEAKEVIGSIGPHRKDISFEYRAAVPYDPEPAVLKFDFSVNEDLPYRINILVGKNGVGKTQILSSLANSLSGFTDQPEDNLFVGKRPPIDKVMSISYSAFDQFRKIPEKYKSRDLFSYVYCGIQSENGTLSLDELKYNLRNAYCRIKELGRVEIWKRVVSALMEAEHQKMVSLISQEQYDEVNLSSGQQILLCTVTELIAFIENESIILFDEPEIHLHPNAISNVMRMFYMLLDNFNSYAIFSTHSPLIIQEIPSRYIQILDRKDDMLVSRRPDIECFGNSINSIIRDVFDVSCVESNFKSYLKDLSKKKSFEEVTALFELGLDMNALIYLKSCYLEAENA